MSGAPPGGIVTRILTGRFGYCCAGAGLRQRAASASAASTEPNPPHRRSSASFCCREPSIEWPAPEAGGLATQMRFPIASGRRQSGASGRNDMALKVRRVITGHDANGKAIVKIDEVVSNIKEGRPGAMAHAIWTTEGFPVNNDGQDDAAHAPGRHHAARRHDLPRGRVQPGVQARNHRTDSIDYAIIMSGEIDMEMDGTMIHLKAGDVLVQRGTIHNWINNGTDAVRHRLRPDRRQAGHGRRQGAQRGGLSAARPTARPARGMTPAATYFASITIASASNSASGRASAGTPIVVLAGGCAVLTYLSRTSR